PEFSDFDDQSVAAFNGTFGLPALTDGTTLVRVPVDGPSSINGNAEFEALLDVQYSHAAAPQTPIRVYIASSSDPANLAFLDSVQKAVKENLCGSISLSIGVCPSDATTATAADTIYQQAAAQGQTVFAASGDDGAAALTVSSKGCVASKVRGVVETAASPNVTAVGGTQSKPKYDKATRVASGPAAEVVWHEAKGATGGGVSVVFPKPSYQDGVTPSDNARDLPDIALLAAIQTPGYFVGVNGLVQCCGGGTSFASPYWAGIDALMEQLEGGGAAGRLGALNTLLYSLASSNAAANGIRDVIKGNNGFNGVKGFTALKGYDQVTGWGTPDINTFAHAFTEK
ncbi:MAG TPA: S53 family peptidase, partial [Candidatus Binataceae bacterium]|nr:S53 family peptidase [Candidatus Binataceae bacterium]